ncbi:MAG: hypothetical protein FWH54_02370, partial [Methanobrevibacter sp.]|nr:hypothetical protein [Methanobrevibacter sp.]
MAGVISGIVALTTGFLGIGGTVIGAVLGAIIYQIISILVKEPLENSTIRKIENDVVYILPLILIAILLMIFIMAYFNTEFFIYYSQLKEFTDNNLLRLMGIGLIIMGIYPLIQSKNIDKKYGAIVLFLGVVLLLRGLIDIEYNVQTFYALFIGGNDYLLNLAIFLALLYVIIKILFESVKLYKQRDKSSIDREIESIKKLRGSYVSGEIKSSKTTTIAKNKDIFNKIKYNKSDNNIKDNKNQNKNNQD